MASYCNGNCDRYKAIVDSILWVQGYSQYAQGFKRCSKCEKFIDKEFQDRCPCCKTKLKGIPQHGNNRQVIEQKKKEIASLLT